MIRPFLLVGAMALLAACANEQSPPQPAAADTPAVVPADAPAQPTAAPATGFDYSPMPAGETRRRVLLEILEGEVEDVALAVSQQFVAAGYRQVEVKDRGDGATRMAVTRKGEGRVNLTANPAVGERPSHPDAKGLLMIDWRLAAAPAAATATGSGSSDPSPPRE